MYASVCIRIGKRLKRRVGAFKCVLGRVVFGWTPLTLRVLKFCTKCLRMRRTTDASTAPAPSVNIAIPFRIYSNYFLVELPITCIMSTKVDRGQHRINRVTSTFIAICLRFISDYLRLFYAKLVIIRLYVPHIYRLPLTP